MLVPVRFQVDFSASEEVVPFRCSRCGFRADVSVSGGGTGLRVSGVQLSQALRDARIGAEQAARLAACPRCGHRNRAALAKVLLVGATVGIIAAIAAGFATAEAVHEADPAGWLGLEVGIAAFLVAVAATTALKLRSVGRRVRFRPPSA